VEEYIATRTSAQIRSHAQKFLSKMDKEPDSEDEQLREILSVNLRALKKTERPVHKNNLKN